MSLSSIIQQYNQKLMHYEQGADQDIRSAHSRMLSAIMPHINALLKQYQQARSGDEKVPLHWLYTENKLPATKRLVASNVNQFAAKAKGQVLTTQKQAVTLGQQSAQAQLGTVTPAHTIKPAPNSQAQKIVGQTQQGKPIDSIMDGFGDEASDRVGKALITGVSIGQEPDTISRAIMAALVISLNRALVIEKTSVAEAFRASMFLTWRENEDLSEGWIWTLGGPRPCQFCRSMAGTKHDLSEDMVSHPNCFCYMEIVIKGA